jgi:hypothetical protein
MHNSRSKIPSKKSRQAAEGINSGVKGLTGNTVTHALAAHKHTPTYVCINTLTRALMCFVCVCACACVLGHAVSCLSLRNFTCEPEVILYRSCVKINCPEKEDVFLAQTKTSTDFLSSEPSGKCFHFSLIFYCCLLYPYLFSFFTHIFSCRYVTSQNFR